jgi:hypothetical protein
VALQTAQFLFDKIARHQHLRADLREAYKGCEQALKIVEEQVGLENNFAATIMNNLGNWVSTTIRFAGISLRSGCQADKNIN